MQDDEPTELASTRPGETQRLKGRYRIERRLGQGGLGIVYLARDESLHDRPVVIKMPLGTTAANPWIVERFAQEVKALAVLDHPGVVGALDSGLTETGQPFLVMQYVEGRPLENVITPEGIPLDYAARVIEQIGRALAAAHARNIFHRDLKPANIMLQRAADGREYVRLIDFGIASVRDSLTQSETQTTVAGTLPYMAPEQLEGRVSAAVDIYALAVIAYQLTTGRKPFVANNAVSLIKLQKAGPLPPSQLRPELPKRAEQLILEGLAFDARDRPRGAAEYAETLAHALVHQGEAATEPLRRDAAASGSRRGPLLATAALAAVVLLIGATFVWSKLGPRNAGTPATVVSPHAQSQTPSQPKADSHPHEAPPPAPQPLVNRKPVNPERLAVAAAAPASPAKADPSRMRETAGTLAQAIVDGKFDVAKSIEDRWNAMRAGMGDVRWHSAPYPHGDSYFVWYELPRGTADLKIDFNAVGGIAQVDFVKAAVTKEPVWAAAESQAGDPARAADLFALAERQFTQAERARGSNQRWDTLMDEAIHRYEDAIQADPHRSEAFSGRCTAEFRLLRYVDALLDCTHAIQLNADNAAAFTRRGDALVGLDRWEYAIPSHDEALRLKPEDNIAWNERAYAYLSGKQWEPCVADATAGLRFNPRNQSLYSNRAECYGGLQKYDAALDDLTQMIALSKNAGAYHQRGKMYSQAKQYAKAIEDFNEAVHLQPHFRNALTDRAYAKDMLGDSAGAAADRKLASDLRQP